MTKGITTRQCHVCYSAVKMDGLGSTSNKFNSIINDIIDTIYPVSRELFDAAARLHDFEYHVLGISKEVADYRFLLRMRRAIKKGNYNYFKNLWLKYQSKKFYLAVKIGGDSAFKKSKSECRKEKEIIFKYSGAPAHPGKF